MRKVKKLGDVILSAEPRNAVSSLSTPWPSPPTPILALYQLDRQIDECSTSLFSPFLYLALHETSTTA